MTQTEKLDPRLNAYRPDLADERLRGKVQAQNYVAGKRKQITAPVISMHRAADRGAEQVNQALYGETMLIFEQQNDWAWGQSQQDGYVGYMLAQNLSEPYSNPDYFVGVPATLVYPHPNIKTQPTRELFFGSLVELSENVGKFFALKEGGFVFASHLKKLSAPFDDFVKIAETFLAMPYYWGGKTMLGFDCSGLVQMALRGVGVNAPRDTDMQQAALGQAVSDPLKRGDLVFWRGHMGVMVSETHLLHATGHYMQVVMEALRDVVARNHPPIMCRRLFKAESSPQPNCPC